MNHLERRIIQRWKSKLSLNIISITHINLALRWIIQRMQLQEGRLYYSLIQFSQVDNQAVTILQVCAQHWRINHLRVAVIIASLRSISLNYSENISFSPFIPCNSLRLLSQRLFMSFNQGKCIYPNILGTLVKISNEEIDGRGGFKNMFE